MNKCIFLVLLMTGLAYSFSLVALNPRKYRFKYICRSHKLILRQSLARIRLDFHCHALTVTLRAGYITYIHAYMVRKGTGSVEPRYSNSYSFFHFSDGIHIFIITALGFS